MRSIRSRLLFYILIVTVIPIIAMLLYTTIFVSNNVKDSEISKNETKLLWAEQYIDNVNEQLHDIVYSLHIKDDLLDAVDNPAQVETSIEEIIKDTLYSNSNILSKVEIVSINSLKKVGFDYRNGFYSKTVPYDSTYITNVSEPVGLRYDSALNQIIVSHTINDFFSKELEGVIILTLNESVEHQLSSIFGEHVGYLLYSSDQEMIQKSDLDRTEIETSNIVQNSRPTTQTIGNYITWSMQIGDQDLYLTSVMTTSSLNTFTYNNIQTGLLIIVFIVMIAVPISILFARDITSPITGLVEHMKLSKLEQLPKERAKYDEILILEDTYNQLMTEIKQLIEEQYKQEIAKKNAQLKALQAQINPHFLANTFQLIGGMAITKNVPEIYDATIKMSKLIRYSMRINEDTTTLQNEIIHLHDYLDIQKLRFGEVLHVDIDILDKYYSIKLPMLTLQPIIENSFKHGLKKKTGTWNIGISVYVDDYTYIEINDNGLGIKEQRLYEVNQQFLQMNDVKEQQFSSIGLVNIDSRIKLLYGEEFGIIVQNGKNEGTTVLIRLPKEVKR